MAVRIRTPPGVPTVFEAGSWSRWRALILLLLTFSITSPTVPRVLAIAIGLVGVATAFGLIPVRAPQDYYGGLVLMMLAVLALIASAELPGQRGFAFGPGTAPRLFAIMLFGLSAAVTLVGVITAGPPIEKYKLRGPAVRAVRDLPVCVDHSSRLGWSLRAS